MATTPSVVQPKTAMNCEETRERLGALQDSELDPDSARSATDHIAGCTACAAALADLGALGNFVRRHGRSPVPAGLLSRIEDQASASAGNGRSFTTWLLPRLAAAGIGALCVGGGWWYFGSNESAVTSRLREPLRSYLRVANVSTTLDDLEQLQMRPENRVLAWARQEAKKR
jgi:anti-sigma factor RsiW